MCKQFDWINIKKMIDKHSESYPDLSWQKPIFEVLSEIFSVIPINQGVYKGKTPEEIAAEKATKDLKAPLEGFCQWQRFSYEPRHIVPDGDKIGIVCGHASGLLAADIDDLSAFKTFCQKNGIPFEFHTLIIQSRENRYHLYFKYPMDGQKYGCRSHKQGKDSEGFDVRGLAGYLIGPSSVHPVTRRPYAIVSTEPIAEAPDWLKHWSLYRSVTAPSTQPMPQQVIMPQPAPSNTSINSLPQNIQTMLQIKYPVGQRSEPAMSLVNSMLQNGMTPDQINQILMQSSFSDVVQQKGQGWLAQTIASGQQFIKTHPALAPEVKHKVDMSKELYQTMLEYEYHLHKDTQRYLAKMSTNDGRAIFYDISGDAFAGKILERQEQKTVTSGSDQDFKKAKRKLMAYVTENAQPIKSLGRFGMDGHVLIWNLAREDGGCIAITPEGYELRQRPQSFLQDYDEALMPIEAVGMACNNETHAIGQLLDLLEVNAEDRHFLTILLLSYLFPEVETPILFLVGEYGTGKTTFAAIIKNIADPLPIELSGGLSLPDKVSDLALELSQQGVILIDNFTGLNKKTQNMLCQAFSFGYFTVKKLYTNGQMIKYPLSCNILMTSLEIPGDLRDDLASRIAVYPVPVRHSFSAKTEIWEKANAIMPQVRGELCALASQVMGRINTYNALGLNRWSNFDKLGQAYFDAIGDADPKGAYETVLRHQLKKNAKAISKKDAAISAFIELIENLGVVVFTMTELYEALLKQRPSLRVPDGAAALGKKLSSKQQQLQEAGIALLEAKRSNGRFYLAATEEELTRIGGEYAVDLLRASPGVIADLHGNDISQWVPMLEYFFYPEGKETSQATVAENTAADAAVDGSPVPDADVESADPISEEVADAIDNGDAAACTVD